MWRRQPISLLPLLFLHSSPLVPPPPALDTQLGRYLDTRVLPLVIEGRQIFIARATLLWSKFAPFSVPGAAPPVDGVVPMDACLTLPPPLLRLLLGDVACVPWVMSSRCCWTGHCCYHIWLMVGRATVDMSAVLVELLLVMIYCN